MAFREAPGTCTLDLPHLWTAGALVGTAALLLTLLVTEAAPAALKVGGLVEGSVGTMAAA